MIGRSLYGQRDGRGGATTATTLLKQQVSPKATTCTPPPQDKPASERFSGIGHAKPRQLHFEADDLETLAQEFLRMGKSRSNDSTNVDEWSASSSEADAIPVQELEESVPKACRLAAASLARAGTRTTEDCCDERPVTDWLTTVELHLLPEELVRQALKARHSEHKLSSGVQGGSALPFAARYALTESNAVRKRRVKLQMELRSLSVKQPSCSAIEIALPPAAAHSTIGITDGAEDGCGGCAVSSSARYGTADSDANRKRQANAQTDTRSLASMQMRTGAAIELTLPTAATHSALGISDGMEDICTVGEQEAHSSPLAATLLTPATPAKDAVTGVVDEHRIDLLSEDSCDEDLHPSQNKPMHLAALGHASCGCGAGRAPWLQPTCLTSSGRISASAVQQQLIRL